MKWVVLILFAAFASGCLDIPKFEQQHWEVVQLHGTEPAGNIAILINKHTGETWATSGANNTWTPMKR
jgi:hypothetical protein